MKYYRNINGTYAPAPRITLKKSLSIFILMGGTVLATMSFLKPETISYTQPFHIVKTFTAPEPAKDKLPPVLKRICACESAGDINGEPQHFDANGEVLRGRVDKNDVGACQINTDANIADWVDEARKLELDIYEEEDNYKMAIYIFENEGTWPWDSSKKCWR